VFVLEFEEFVTMLTLMPRAILVSIIGKSPAASSPQTN
jgi:hypothetical protein